MGWTAFLFSYLLGGVTFLPLVVIGIFIHGYLTLPHRNDLTNDGAAGKDTDPDSIVQLGDDIRPLEKAQKDEASHAHREIDVAAGYFAVCREYTPMGINAKPIERSTPVGSTTVAAPSPSVYQTMYRSIFDRKQTPGPLDNAKNTNLRPKKAGNVFYVVLRHGHLMLFDDDEQLEVRHVISLAHHDISVYSGGDVTPEGELFIKRNALCLSRKPDGVEMGPDTQVTKPFYLFSENCSAKEDFYFALLRNQEQTFTAEQGPPPKPVQFDMKNIISLVQKLHSSEEHLQTRWLNAMIGRIFLGVYRTRDVEAYIRAKITKKISRVKTPSFLSDIIIREIDTGDAAPYFINPRLKDLTVEGECGIETDVRYTGNFRIEVATKARIDLGSRFKVREVDLVLAVSVRKVEGHILFKIKPPPSNRIWFSFQQMPKVEMTIEPVVSARQITYTVILRQIENRIKEVIAESVVLPFWDDVPFFRTEHKRWRGGIFSGDDQVVPPTDQESAAAEHGDLDKVDQMEEGGPAAISVDSDLPPMEKSHSVPVLENTAPTGFFGRKNNNKVLANSKASASTTGFDIKNGHAPHTSTPLRPLQSSSAANLNAPNPPDSSHQMPSDENADHANAMAILSGRRELGGGASGAVTPAGSPLKSSALSKASSRSSLSSKEAADRDEQGEDAHHEATPTAHIRLGSQDSGISADGTASMRSNKGSLKGQGAAIKNQAGTMTKNFFQRRNSNLNRPSTPSNGDDNETGWTQDLGRTDIQKRNTMAAVSNAAGVAKRWGLDALQRHKEAVNARNANRAAGLDNSRSQVDLSQPMGRGQPLPPPGMPLPGPDRRSNGRGGAIPQPKRKPLAEPPPLPERNSGSFSENRADMGGDRLQQGSKVERRPVPPPPLPRRTRQLSQPDPDEERQDEGMLVVEAPLADSEPGSPAASAKEGRNYVQPFVNDVDDGTEVEAGAGLGTKAHDVLQERLRESWGKTSTLDDDNAHHEIKPEPVAPDAEGKVPETQEEAEENEKERELLEDDLQPRSQLSSSELPLVDEKAGLHLPAEESSNPQHFPDTHAGPEAGEDDDVSAWVDDAHDHEQADDADEDEPEHQHRFGYEQATAPRVDEALVTSEGMAL
jgi:hypothetical protein